MLIYPDYAELFVRLNQSLFQRFGKSSLQWIVESNQIRTAKPKYTIANNRTSKIISLMTASNNNKVDEGETIWFLFQFSTMFNGFVLHCWGNWIVAIRFWNIPTFLWVYLNNATIFNDQFMMCNVIFDVTDTKVCFQFLYNSKLFIHKNK